jgi:hypothetical protein
VRKEEATLLLTKEIDRGVGLINVLLMDWLYHETQLVHINTFTHKRLYTSHHYPSLCINERPCFFPKSTKFFRQNEALNNK